MRRVVYLSGGIANLSYDVATQAREEAKQALTLRGWDCLDPMRGKEILSTLATIEEDAAAKLLNTTPAAIVQRDYDDVRRCDALLVLSGNIPSWGTAFEWAIAEFVWRKPVVVVCGADSPTRKHPWCKQMASAFCTTVDEAIDFLTNWFDRGYLLGETP